MDKFKLFKILKNKYIIAMIIFLALILFIDPALKDFFYMKAENEALQKEIDDYDSKIRQVEKETEDLKINNDSLEKFARENFFMKRANEEIFLME